MYNETLKNIYLTRFVSKALFVTCIVYNVNYWSVLVHESYERDSVLFKCLCDVLITSCERYRHCDDDFTSLLRFFSG
jgi:hypothetical protein